MTAPAEAPRLQRTYGDWRRPESPGLWGLGTYGTAVVVATPALCVLGGLASIRIAIAMAVLGLVLVTPVAIRVGGRTAGEMGLVRVAFARQKSKGEHVYVSGLLAKPHGAHKLPGLMAKSELVEARDGFDRPAGIIIIPQTGHYSGVLRLDPEGGALVDQEQVDQWVAHYGAWLANLSQEPGFVGATITVETAPDPGTRLANAVAAQRADDAPELAGRVLDTIVATYPTGSAQVTAWCVLTYRSTGSKSRKGRDAMINHVASRLPGLAEGLRATGAGAVRPMSAAEITDIVKTAYDPEMGPVIEQLRMSGQTTGVTWRNAGPKAAIASWDAYRHDSGLSRVWSMDEAPRGTVQAGVLARLLEPHPQIPRKRVTLVHRPHTPGEAAKIVDTDLRTTTFNSETGRHQARRSAAIRAAERAAIEEAAGAGVTRFSLLVSVTVANSTDLDDADVIVDGLEGTARLQLRPVYAGQPSAFASMLPTGLILPEHGLIPTSIREAV